MKNEKYLPIIGLEIHIQLNTQSKMFCGCSTDIFGAKPNAHTCPVCLGLPGALPVPNYKAIEKTIQLAQALDCEINLESHFDRKNYFYPDLPKGYQITQYEGPIGLGGQWEILNSKSEIRNKIRIRRVHLEEDTGTLKHRGDTSLINFNRSGIPLVEIVTEPDLHSAEDAKDFLKNLHQLVRWIDVGDADMEKGSMRLEPSVSVLEIRNPKSEIRNKSQFTNDQITKIIKDQGYPDYRVELKNINSFRYAERAIKLEIERLTQMLEKGQAPQQETRGYDEDKDITFEQRAKEEEADYRYFPEPDIPPLRFTSNQIDTISRKLPELPNQILEFLISNFEFLNEEKANQLIRGRATYDYFSRLVELNLDPEEAANLVINQPEKMNLNPKGLVKALQKEKEGAIDSTEELGPIVQEVIQDNPDAVADYKGGDENAINFLIGQVMRETQGKAQANTVRELLLETL